MEVKEEKLNYILNIKCFKTVQIFLFYDSGEDDLNLFFIFATEKNMKILRSSKVWHFQNCTAIILPS